MIAGILQARTTSTRLPGKVLKPILGRPMMALQIERLQRCRKLDTLLVATSTDASDDAIATLCEELRLPCFRGSLDDVLDRYYHAARSVAAEHVVRLTADCPLADWNLIDGMVQFYLDGGWDYVSNTLEPTFPHGLDAEVVRFAALEAAWKEARLPSQREHVTPFIYHHPERFRIAQYKNDRDLSGLRWTVDHPEDFELVRCIYEALYPRNPAFTTADVLALLEADPELSRLNSRYDRGEGMRRSQAKDAESPQRRGAQ